MGAGTGSTWRSLAWSSSLFPGGMREPALSPHYHAVDVPPQGLEPASVKALALMRPLGKRPPEDRRASGPMWGLFTHQALLRCTVPACGFLKNEALRQGVPHPTYTLRCCFSGSPGYWNLGWGHTGDPVPKPGLCLLRKKWELFVLDPAGDWYYRWLFVIAMPVFYNWCLLVAR